MVLPLIAGMQEGDLVTKIDGQSIDSWQELAVKVQASAGEALTFEYVRDGEVIKSTITPKSVEQDGETVWSNRCFI